MTKVEGGCLCGAVRYHSDIDAVATAVCHCRNCQRQSGSAFSILVAVPAPSLKVEGAVSSFRDTADSGGDVERQFCGTCGSALISRVGSMPDLAWIKAGTLDDVSTLQPQMHIWCDSAQPWVTLPDDLPRMAGNP
jgi:hypothetical protein